jgi:hypothetical protein
LRWTGLFITNIQTANNITCEKMIPQ